MPAPPTSKQQQSIKSPANTKSKSYGSGTSTSWGGSPKPTGTGGNQYSFSGAQFGNGPQTARTGTGGSKTAPMGFSQAQFGGQRLSPKEIYSNPDKSGSALRSVINNINLMGGTPAQKVDAMLRNTGYANPAGRAGMIGTFAHESGNFNPKVISGDILGDTNTEHPAFGMAQWRNDRQKAVKDYLASMGLPQDSLAGQAAFAGNELASSYPKAYQGVMNAQTPQQGVAAMNAYERPFGWKPGGDPAKVAGWKDRVARANTAFGMQPPATGMQPTLASFPSPTAAPQATSQPQTGFLQGLFNNVSTAAQNAAQNAKPTLDMINNLPGTPDQKAAIVGAFAKDGKTAAAAKYLDAMFGGLGTGPFDNGRREGEANQGPVGMTQQAQAKQETPQLTSDQQQQLLSLDNASRQRVQDYMRSGMTFEQAMKVLQGTGQEAGNPPAPWQFPAMITRPYTRIA
jgi:hypothetical protein